MSDKTYSAIVIGASAGGVESMPTLLSALPANFSMPIFIVQHQSERASNDGFIEHFYNKHCALAVKEAKHGEVIKTGCVYLSVPGYHLQIERNRTLSLSIDPPVNYAIPSINVLFETAVDVYHSRLVGVILTGSNDDGAAGLQAISQSGGLSLVQNPHDALFSIMPEAAIKRTQVDHVFNLADMAMFLKALSGGEK